MSEKIKRRIRQFLSGTGSVLEVYSSRPIRIHNSIDVWVAIEGDFRKVGDDIFYIIEANGVEEIRRAKRSQESEKAKHDGQLELELSN